MSDTNPVIPRMPSEYAYEPRLSRRGLANQIEHKRRLLWMVQNPPLCHVLEPATRAQIEGQLWRELQRLEARLARRKAGYPKTRLTHTPKRG